MKREEAIAIIREEFAHVEVEKIVVEYDPSAGYEVAKVFVRTDQIGAAFRRNGIHARNAAIRSGLTVEIEEANPKPRAKSLRTENGEGPVGRFILHRFCGDEEYAIKRAEMFAIRCENGIRLWFEAETDGVRLKSQPDTAELHAHPKAEVGVLLAELDPRRLVGRQFEVQSAYDDQEESYVASIYYVEHESLESNQIKIASQDGEAYLVRWTGVTTDVNHYDGSKPPTTLEIEGRFTFIDMQEWIAEHDGRENRGVKET